MLCFKIEGIFVFSNLVEGPNIPSSDYSVAAKGKIVVLRAFMINLIIQSLK